MNRKFSEFVYERPDTAALQAWLADAAERIRAASRYETVREILLAWNERAKRMNQAVSILYIRHFGDASDTFYEKEFGEVLPAAAALDSSDFSRALVDSPFAPDIDREFGRQYLDLTRRDIRLHSAGHALLAKEQALIAEYQQIKATLKIPFDGKILSEGETEAYADSADRDVRRAVTHARYDAYLARRAYFVRLLSELVETRTGIAKANGFQSYLDYMNDEKGRAGYGEQELTAFCEQVKRDLVPYVEKLGRAQARRLGLPKLMPYDQRILFPDGNPKPFSADALLEGAKTMYDGLGEETRGFYRMMLECELLDVKPSANKIAGMGFCTELPVDRLPFVFGNCNGTSWDVAVVTHEIGHAFQMYLSMQAHEIMEYASPCNDVAEVPSKTMELFSYPYAEKFTDDPARFRFHHLQNALEEIIGYCCIHEYETWLYSHPEADTDTRIRMFEEVRLRYDPTMDNSEFRAELDAGALLFRSMAVYMFPRYVISYALSEMCALAFMERMERDPAETWAGYVRLCRAGGSLPYPELLKLAGLDLAYADGSVLRATAGAKRILTDYVRAEGLWDAE